MIRSLVTFLLLPTVFFLTYGQAVQELEHKLLDKDLTVENKIELLNLLSREYVFINSAIALDYANKALKLSVQTNNKIGIAYAYRNISGVYTNNEIYYLGMEYSQRSQTIFEESGDSLGIANSYITLGFIYRRLQKTELEIAKYKKAFEAFSALNIPERIAVSAHNLGESYMINNEFEQSKALTQIAIQITDSIKNFSVLSACYKVMGIINFKQQQYDTAEMYFLKVLELSASLGKNSQKTATIESLVYLADIYDIKGKDKMKIGKLEEAAEFCLKYSLSSYLPNIYLNLIQHYTSENNTRAIQKFVVEYRTISKIINQKELKDKSDLVNSLV
ncbi:MAG TPA: hypothetical protein DCQ31_15170, partial [Bacteroidales bacterium]|nr:hypothetical protein [Bacteroidales bacterium]